MAKKSCHPRHPLMLLTPRTRAWACTYTSRHTRSAPAFAAKFCIFFFYKTRIVFDTTGPLPHTHFTPPRLIPTCITNISASRAHHPIVLTDANADLPALFTIYSNTHSSTSLSTSSMQLPLNFLPNRNQSTSEISTLSGQNWTRF